VDGKRCVRLERADFPDQPERGSAPGQVLPEGRADKIDACPEPRRSLGKPASDGMRWHMAQRIFLVAWPLALGLVGAAPLRAATVASLPGFPARAVGAPSAGVLVLDLDGDRRPEIVVTAGSA